MRTGARAHQYSRGRRAGAGGQPASRSLRQSCDELVDAGDSHRGGDHVIVAAGRDHISHIPGVSSTAAATSTARRPRPSSPTHRHFGVQGKSQHLAGLCALVANSTLSGIPAAQHRSRSSVHDAGRQSRRSIDAWLSPSGRPRTSRPGTSRSVLRCRSTGVAPRPTACPYSGTGVVNDQHILRIAEVLDLVVPQIVTERLDVPVCPPQQLLHPVRLHVPGLLRVQSFLRPGPDQPAPVLRHPPPRLRPAKSKLVPRVQPVQLSVPAVNIGTRHRQIKEASRTRFAYSRRSARPTGGHGHPCQSPGLSEWVTNFRR